MPDMHQLLAYPKAIGAALNSALHIEWNPYTSFHGQNSSMNTQNFETLRYFQFERQMASKFHGNNIPQ